MSPLAWGRGLKLKGQREINGTHHVAPRVGAWIETSSSVLGDSKKAVAPRVGAWIETPSADGGYFAGECRPSRGGVD